VITFPRTGNCTVCKTARGREVASGQFVIILCSGCKAQLLREITATQETSVSTGESRTLVFAEG
jgi:hypothetical protein